MARDLQPCGTVAAYYRHVRREEEPCTPCLKAKRDYHATYTRERRANDPDFRAAHREYSRPSSKAYGRALRTLASRHPEEFAQLLSEAKDQVRAEEAGQ